MSARLAANGRALLLCWNSLLVQPNRQPNKIIKSSNYEQKLKRNPSVKTAVDSEQKDESLFVSQHSSQAKCYMPFH
jgi:hypothetical protein